MLRTRQRLLIILALLVASAFTFLSLVSFHHDQIGNASPLGNNLCGPLGATFAHLTLWTWGIAAFIIPIAFLGFAIAYMRHFQGRHLALRITGVIIIIPVVAGLAHLFPENRLVITILRHWDQPHLQGLGGTLGHLLCGSSGEIEGRQVSGGILLANLQLPGTLLVLAACAAAGLALINMGLRNLGRNMYYAVKDRVDQPRKKNISREFTGMQNPAVPSQQQPRVTTSVDEVTKRIAAVGTGQSLDANDLVERIRRRRQQLGDTDTDDLVPPDTHSGDRSGGTTSYAAQHASEMESLPEIEDAISDPLAPLRGAQPLQASSLSRPPPDPAAAEKPRESAKKPRSKDPAGSGYRLPDIAILEEAPERRDSEHDADIAETSHAIEATFNEFNIGLKVVAATRGPVITQYEMELLDAGMRVSKVGGFEKDLALKLGTEGIRIVAPLPNRKTIGIEVPNGIKEAVVMKGLVEEIDPDDYILPLILGRDVLGRPMVGDLAKMPHLLVAGATGMGKSVCMNAMICSILLFKDPALVKFIMVDPKMVELAGYEDIPHLLTPPITDMSKAHAALEWATKTMDERYYALRMAGVRNIADYNALGEKELTQRLERKGKDLADLPGID
ncbi:MAG: hypothetical protein EA401_03230, partial [Planctomycetota bacterium]